VADLLVKAGVQAIWNFAPTTLDLPAGILVKNENLAASLAALTTELRRRTSSTTSPL
jgi:redox-sensing transcriptional repressor